MSQRPVPLSDSDPDISGSDSDSEVDRFARKGKEIYNKARRQSQDAYRDLQNKWNAPDSVAEREKLSRKAQDYEEKGEGFIRRTEDRLKQWEQNLKERHDKNKIHLSGSGEAAPSPFKSDVGELSRSALASLSKRYGRAHDAACALGKSVLATQSASQAAGRSASRSASQSASRSGY